jgi:RNA polymerase sigma factor for flagellar operon FliA
MTSSTLNPRELAERNLPLVHHVAQNLFPEGDRHHQVRRAGGYDEIISCGLLALVRAARTFNPRRGYQFSTYAYKAVARAMVEQVRYHWRTVRIRHGGSESYEDYLAKVDRVPPVLSIYGVDRDESQHPLDKSPDPSTCAEASETSQWLRAAFARLPAKLARTLRGRYWHGLSLQQLAEQEGITSEAVRKRQQQAERLLRSYLSPN